MYMKVNAGLCVLRAITILPISCPVPERGGGVTSKEVRVNAR